MALLKVLALLAAHSSLASSNPNCAAQDELQTTLSRLQDLGYKVTEHKFKVSNSTGFGANPGNPYVVYNMPTTAFRMDARDGILFVGCTPGKTRYFSWRSYLMVDPKFVFASLGDSVNNLVINTTGGGIYDSTAAVVTTADARTFADVSEALGAAGLGDAVNLDGFDATLLKRPGLSTFTVLHRAAIWEDEAAQEAYFAQVRPVYYLKAPKRRVAAPLPSLPLRQPGTGQSEADVPGLSDGLVGLEAAVAAWAVSKNLTELSRVPLGEYQPDGFALDGFKCIEAGTNCIGDNRDTHYFANCVGDNCISTDDTFQLAANQVLLFFGPNSVATGKCTYTNLGIYKGFLEEATSLTLDDRNFTGSAEYFAPDLDAKVASKLFAVALARDCSGLAFCLELPESEVSMGGNMSVVYRTYLEPVTKTGPLASELVIPRGIVFGQAVQSVLV